MEDRKFSSNGSFRMGQIHLIALLIFGCSRSDAWAPRQRPPRALGSRIRFFSSRSDTQTTMSLEEIQRRSADIITSFKVTEDFDPKIVNGHVQSILGFFLRETCAYVPRNESPLDFFQRIQNGFKMSSKETDNASFWDRRERIETHDGDWFHVDYKDSTATMTTVSPTVFLLHGLQSSSYGNLAVEMTRAYIEAGMNVAALNFRGCSKDAEGNNLPNDTLGAYHLGFTKDLLQFMEIFHQREPNTPIYLSGFSLGANVVLKCLGDLGEHAADWNIQGAAVLCAPLDQIMNAPVLARPFSIQRYVYTDGLLKSLKKMALSQLERLNAFDKVSVELISSAETISEFDDAFIAPIYGFQDCWDYYRQTSSIHVVDRIAVPTLVVNAKDDPFFDNNVWPTHLSCENGGPSPLKMVHFRSGGHLGFVFHQVESDDERIGSTTPSFGSYNAARFLEHVHIHADNNK